MPPIQPQNNMPEDNSNDILIDATMETNDKLADIAESSDVQVQGIMETNAELNELNRSVDILIEKAAEPKPEVQKVELIGAEFVTIKGKDFKYEDFTDEQLEALKVKGDKGEKGDKGDKPSPMELVGLIKPMIPAPIKGEDGKDGVDGYTPIKGVDYNDGKTPSKAEIEKIIKPLIPKLKEIKAKSITSKEVKDKLLEAGIEYTEIKNAPVWKPSSKTTSLTELDDVNLTGLTQTNGKYNLGSGGSGGVQSVVAGTGITVDATDPANPIVAATALAPAWGDITGTLSNQTDLQTALDGKVDENASITGATKTKITYDAKGLVTAGADATTADIADSSNKRYVTDAQLTVIGNTSGTNTGDQDISGKQNILSEGAFVDGDKTKLDGIETGAEVNTIDTVTDTAEIDLTVTARALTASIVASSIDESKLDASVNASLDLADSALQAEADTLDTVTGRGATTDNTITLSPSGNNGALVANGSGSGTAIDITHTGSGTKLNIGDGGSGDLIVAGIDKFKVTDAGVLSMSGLTASEILITDASKNIVSGAVATYPSLTELSYVKGVTSAIQTQLNTKLSSVSLAATQVGYGSAGGVLTGDSGLTWDSTNKYLNILKASNTYGNALDLRDNRGGGDDRFSVKVAQNYTELELLPSIYDTNASQVVNWGKGSGVGTLGHYYYAGSTVVGSIGIDGTNNFFLSGASSTTFNFSVGNSSVFNITTGASSNINATAGNIFGSGSLSLLGTTNTSGNTAGIVTSAGTSMVLRANGADRISIDSSGNVGVGVASPSARFHTISTTEQVRTGYDVSNYFSTTVSSTGGVTFDAVGSGAGFTFSDAVNITSSLQCDSIVNDTGLASGTYTPTLTGVSNVSSSTARQATYMRVGNTVTVSGQIDVTPTANNTQTTIGISLPIASAFTTAYQCGGAGHTAPNVGAGHGVAIYADATNDRAEMDYYETNGALDTITYTYTYQVI